MPPRHNEELILFNFSDPLALVEWTSVNDAVMGGVSEGYILWKDECTMLFSGSISFENNGGFSSIRSTVNDYNLSAYKGILIAAQGDGKRYKFTIRTTSSYDGASYQNHFLTIAKERRDYYLPFAAFLPSYHGKKLTNQPPLNPSLIKRFGFIIADSQEGPFSLGIETISAVR
ncbi:MAG: CIA30 family protein [Proteobacteria bacterium]|nr:CIA30 family protein [Pseudomonadota bacterium]MBU1057826.1 CIA30 family protein [Pseudomonadota bacterium]